MKIGTAILLLTCMSGLVLGQNNTAGFLPHFYTGQVSIASTTGLSQTDYTQALSRPNVFSATEDVSVGTALIDYSTGPLPSGSSGLIGYAHIEISNPRLTSNKQAFQFTLKTDLMAPAANKAKVNIYHVTISVIAIGEGFRGPLDVPPLTQPFAPSQDIFARNADMIAVNTETSTPLVSFKHTASGLQSPFQWAQGTDAVCGAVKRGGKWVIQTACDAINATIYITGIQFRVPEPTLLMNEAKIGSTPLQKQINLKDTSKAKFTAATSGFGLQIPYTQTRTEGVQFSMVVIAFRIYANNYPVQSTYENDFKANTYLVATIPKVTSGSQTTTIGDPSASAVPYYSEFGADRFSDRFCGLSEIKVTQNGTLNSGMGIGFDLVSLDLSQKLGQVDPRLEANTVSNSITINDGSNQFAYNCQLFVARNPLPACAESNTTLYINSSSVQYALANTSAGTDVTIGTTTSLYAPGVDPNYLGAASVIATQKVKINNTITYTFNILGTPSTSAYEGILYLTSDTTNAAVNENIKVQVFGNLVVDSTDSLTTSKLYHFSFINANTNNQVVITYTLNQTLSSDALQVLEFKLVKHNVVYLTNGTCGSVCAATAGTSVGIDYNYNPSKCIECSLAQNQVFEPTTATCECKAGYILNPNTNVCQPCAINLCATCSLTSTANDVCPQCVINAQPVVVPPSATPVCKCVAGYYENPNPAYEQCVACSPGCATCTSGAACSTCKSTTTRNTSSLNCTCLTGFFQANQAECVACSAPCLTCNISATSCATCNTTANFELSGSTCVCKQGYYSKVVNGSVVCLKCDVSCANCSIDASKCISCKTSMWTFTSDGTCVCRENLYYYRYDNNTMQAFCVNLNCTDINKDCVECGVAFEPPRPVCKVCDPARNVVPSADLSTCVCKVGYRNTSTGCTNCSANCQTCTATACTSCASGSYLNNGVCSPCPDGTYLLVANNVMVCASCNATCLTCSGSINNCSSCRTGFDLVAGSCVCKTGRFVTADNYCNPCMTGCASCANATHCTQCLFNYIATATPTGTICAITCARGYFRADPLCLPCPAGCLACENPYNCTACATGTYSYLGTCVGTCPNGTLPYITGECIACSQTCKTCANTPYQCTSCYNGNITYLGQCVTNCPTGTFYNAATATCQQCVGDCITCVDNPNKCTSCPTGKWLFQGACYPYCPTYPIGTTCSPTCQPGKYFNGTTCAFCNTSCATCDAYPACLTCKAGLIYKGTCVPSCPANTIQINGVCYDCDSACVGCSGSTTNCIQCIAGAYRLDTRCYVQCPDTYYADPLTMTCKRCDADCKTCAGPARCQVCLNGSAAVGGFCAGSCGANCLTCVNGACTTCAPNYFWNGISCDTYCAPPSSALNGVCVCPTGTILFRASCITTCPAGFYRLNNACLACNSPCATCTATANTCDSCVAGFTFDQINRKCTANIVCELGKYASNFGCRFICPEGSYFLDYVCYDSKCPDGYNTNDALRICTKKPQGVGCTQPYFLQGDTCVLQCRAGFYPNSDTRVCTPCSTNCLVCSSAQSCGSCAIGFTPSNGFCILLGDPCPPNLFRSNYGCVSACPYGTFGQDGYCIRRCGSGQYFWNGGCYETCPTNLRTQDGCVVVCPTGFTAQGNVCVSSPVPTCSVGQFYNTLSRQCENCRYPCASCSGASTFCTSCVQAFTLRSGVCISDNSCPAGSYPTAAGCQRCPIKCATCIDATTCTSCAPNYINTGSDCVQSSTTLNNVVLQTASVTSRDSTVFIQVRPNILPNNLPTSLQSQILIFASSIPLDGARVNIWVEGQFIYVAITHAGPIPTYDAVLILNSNVMANIFLSMGYTTTNVFTQARVSPNLPPAPPTLIIPPTSYSSRVHFGNDLSTIYSLKLNSLVSKAVNFSQRAPRL